MKGYTPGPHSTVHFDDGRTKIVGPEHETTPGGQTLATVYVQPGIAPHGNGKLFGQSLAMLDALAECRDVITANVQGSLHSDLLHRIDELLANCADVPDPVEAKEPEPETTAPKA